MRLFSDPHWGIRLLFYGLLALFAYATFLIVQLLLLPLAIGGLTALLLQPSVHRCESMGLSQKASIGLVFSLFLCIILGIFWLAGPRLYSELKQLQSNHQTYLQALGKKYGQFKASLEQRYPHRIPWRSLEKSFRRQPTTADAARLFAFLKRLGSGLEWFFSVLLLAPLIAYFLLKDGLHFKKWLLQFVPNRYFEMVLQLHYNINRQIIAFVRGQFLDSMINALLLSIGLLLIGLPYAVLVALFGGLANAIPILGPIVAASTGVLIAIVTGTCSPWIVLFVFLVVHLIDVTTIYPKTVGHSLDVPELLVILGVFAGGFLGGIVGMLIAVPLIGISMRSMQIIFRTLRGYRIL